MTATKISLTEVWLMTCLLCGLPSLWPGLTPSPAESPKTPCTLSVGGSVIFRPSLEWGSPKHLVLWLCCSRGQRPFSFSRLLQDEVTLLSSLHHDTLSRYSRQSCPSCNLYATEVAHSRGGFFCPLSTGLVYNNDTHITRPDFGVISDYENRS